MNFCKSFLPILVLTAIPVSACAQRALEWQLHSVATIGSESFVGGGTGLALRTSGRMRAGVVVNVGHMGGTVAVRPEILGSFHLNPFKRQGVSPYAGGGVAAVLSEGTSREYIVAFVGLESRPGRSFGWFAEGGIGGGARVTLGVQFRKRRTRAR